MIVVIKIEMVGGRRDDREIRARRAIMIIFYWSSPLSSRLLYASSVPRRASVLGGFNSTSMPKSATLSNWNMNIRRHTYRSSGAVVVQPVSRTRHSCTAVPRFEAAHNEGNVGITARLGQVSGSQFPRE